MHSNSLRSCVRFSRNRQAARGSTDASHPAVFPPGRFLIRKLNISDTQSSAFEYDGLNCV
ncbi:MAG: hypothetical protein EOP84_29435 [Verrucomicrobiaceae bacterium]|nr:MAG: hypothetical protein EOP84_29435 [Verrucomicrobiaceae bacterium]